MSVAWSVIHRSRETVWRIGHCRYVDRDGCKRLGAYHVEKDWAENYNVAAENRSKLIEMITIWYAEAGKYNVLPIDGRGILRLADGRLDIAINRTHYTYYPGTQRIPTNAAVKVLNRSAQYHSRC